MLPEASLVFISDLIFLPWNFPYSHLLYFIFLYKTMLSTVVTIRSSGLINPIVENLNPFNNHTLFPPFLNPKM